MPPFSGLPGEYEYAYMARATTPGIFLRPAGRVEAMYEPEVAGTTQIGITISLWGWRYASPHQRLVRPSPDVNPLLSVYIRTKVFQARIYH